MKKIISLFLACLLVIGALPCTIAETEENSDEAFVSVLEEMETPVQAASENVGLEEEQESALGEQEVKPNESVLAFSDSGIESEPEVKIIEEKANTESADEVSEDMPDADDESVNMAEENESVEAADEGTANPEPVEEKTEPEEEPAIEPEKKDEIKSDQTITDDSADLDTIDEPDEPEQDEKIKETEETEENPDEPEEDSDEQELETAPRFCNGYVIFTENANVYADEKFKDEIGTIAEDSVVYVFGRVENENPETDPLHIAFAVDGEVKTAYVRADHVAEYTEEIEDPDGEYLGNGLYNVLFTAAVSDETDEKDEEPEIIESDEPLFVDANNVPYYVLASAVNLYRDGEKLGKTLTISTKDEPFVIEAINSPADRKVYPYVIFTNSNAKVVTMDIGADGRTALITPLAPGSATIKAEAIDGSKKSFSLKITVQRPSETVTITGQDVLLAAKSMTLKATVLPADTTNKKVIWSVEPDSEGLIKVTTSGKVTAAKTIAEETPVRIKATAADGSGAQDIYEFLVRPACTQVKLYNDEGTAYGKSVTVDFDQYPDGVALDMHAETLPYDAIKYVTYKSSNEKVVEVVESRLYVRGTGKATITATVNDGTKKSVTCAVTVNRMPHSVTLGALDTQLITEGKTLQLKAEVLPENATNKKVTWTTSDKTAATVSTSGKVTVLKGSAGKTVMITVTSAADPTLTDSVELTVLPAATKVELWVARDSESFADAVLVAGKQMTCVPADENSYLKFFAVNTPEDADYKNIKWAQSGTAVGTGVSGIDEESGHSCFKLNTAKAGKTTIKATTLSGKTVSVELTVMSSTLEGIKIIQADERIGRGTTQTIGYELIPKTAIAAAPTAEIIDGQIYGQLNGLNLTFYPDVPIGAEITVRVSSGSVVSEPVTYYATPLAESIELSGASFIDGAIRGTVGNELDLQVKFYPEEASQKYTVSFAKNGLCKVEGNALIPIKAGETKLKITTLDKTKSWEFPAYFAAEESHITISGPDKVAAGKSVTLKATDTAKGKFVWSTSDKTMATVKDGKVTALKKLGDFIVYAAPKSGVGETAEYHMTVTPLATMAVMYYQGEEIKEMKIDYLAQPDMHEFDLKTKVLPDDGEIPAIQDVTWKTSNKKIATVDENGHVTVLAGGTVTITATAADGSKKAASLKLTVTYLVDTIKISGPDEVLAGTGIQLTATALPEKAAKRTVKWTTSNKKVATVDSKGFVKGLTVSEPTAVVITATAADGSGVTATKTVTVYPTATKLAFNTAKIELAETDTVDLADYIKLTPEGAGNAITGVTYSKAGIVSIDPDSGIMTGLSMGETKVTITLDNKKSASVIVSVAEKPFNPQLIAQFDDKSGEIGQTYTWTATSNMQYMTVTFSLYRNGVLLRTSDTYEEVMSVEFSFTPMESGAYRVDAYCVDPRGYEKTISSEILPVLGDIDIPDDDTSVKVSLKMNELGGVSAVVVGAEIGQDGILEIPAKIDQIPVSEIEANAFAENGDLVRLIIPETITLIGENAFAGCESLAYVEIKEGSTIKEISAGAFEGCESLTEAVLSDSIEVIGERAFRGCVKLCTITSR